MNSLQQILELSPSTQFELIDFISSLSAALLASVVAYGLYMATYARHNIGVGVQKMFLIGGPSITALLLAVQFSLPLSLGLLGALSIVRFRAPVKDPEEIGFLLLVIAGAIGCATFNYWLVIILYLIASIVLLSKRLIERMPEHGRSSLIISADDPEISKRGAIISEFMTKQFRDVRLETVSTFGGRAQFHYLFNRPSKYDWGEFKRNLDGLVEPATTELHVG